MYSFQLSCLYKEKFIISMISVGKSFPSDAAANSRLEQINQQVQARADLALLRMLEACSSTINELESFQPWDDIVNDDSFRSNFTFSSHTSDSQALLQSWNGLTVFFYNGYYDVVINNLMEVQYSLEKLDNVRCVLFRGDCDIPEQFQIKGVKELIFLGETSVGMGAFNCSQELEKITFEELAILGASSFSDCPSLKEVICESRIDIGQGALGRNTLSITGRGMVFIKRADYRNIGRQSFKCAVTITDPRVVRRQFSLRL